MTRPNGAPEARGAEPTNEEDDLQTASYPERSRYRPSDLRGGRADIFGRPIRGTHAGEGGLETGPADWESHSQIGTWEGSLDELHSLIDEDRQSPTGIVNQMVENVERARADRDRPSVVNLWLHYATVGHPDLSPELNHKVRFSFGTPLAIALALGIPDHSVGLLLLWLRVIRADANEVRAALQAMKHRIDELEPLAERRARDEQAVIETANLSVRKAEAFTGLSKSKIQRVRNQLKKGRPRSVI